MTDEPLMPIPRCDRCLYWWRDVRTGAPAYPQNRSMCLKNGSDGMACAAGTFTTRGDFGCVRFVPMG